MRLSTLISVAAALYLVVAAPVRAAGARLALPPFCQNAMELITQDQAGQIRVENAQVRELFILQALGLDGLHAVQNAIKQPPLQKIQTLEEALGLVDLVADDPTVYGPINEIMNRLSPAQSWALYLNSGFHAVSTHTDDHRNMVQQAIDQFPRNQRGADPTRVIDVGIGNGNLVAAAAIRNPFGIVYGLDIAGSGVNISTVGLNTVSDLAAAKYKDPGLSSAGRFYVGRGSASDPQMFRGQRFDAASMVLTLFAVPTAQRNQALQNIYDSLQPGARFVLIDPVPAVGGALVGRAFLREIVRNAYQNNPDLTTLDVALLTAKNAHQLLRTDFLTPEQQRAMVEGVGFRGIGNPQPVYYGIASMQVFEKPL